MLVFLSHWPKLGMRCTSPHSRTKSCAKNDITSIALLLPLTVTIQTFPLLTNCHTCAVPSSIPLLQCSSPEQQSWYNVRRKIMHPLYGAGSLSFSHFLQRRPTSLCCLGTTELIIVFTAVLHCSAPTDMARDFRTPQRSGRVAGRCLLVSVALWIQRR